MITFIVAMALFMTGIVTGWAAIWAWIFTAEMCAAWVVKVWLVTGILGFLVDTFTSYKGNSAWY